MDCNHYRLLVDADTDGELDVVRHLELADHLGTCPACTRHAEAARARRAALRESLPRYSAPPPLADKILAGLPPGVASVRPPARRRVSPMVMFWSLTGLAASLVLALAVGFAWGDRRARRNVLIDEVVNDHARSLKAEHLVDVASTDQHTVKPWFAGKLDFAPPVVDLAAAGFPLAGGRLEQVEGRPAAALVFHRRAHAINLFIWPVTGGALAAHRSGHNGYHTECWSQGSLNFFAVSEIPSAELAQFADAFRANQQ